jgi:hypothetical protein
MDGWIVISIIIGGLALLVARHMGLAAAVKGQRGEFIVRQTLLSKLSRYDYQILENIKLDYRDGVIQIDHIVVSRYGIFLVECLHTSGTLTASEHASKWSRKWRGMNKSVVNPMRKNRVHLNVLAARLGLPESLFHPLVVITANTGFDGPMPSGVVKTGGMLPFIRIRNDEQLDPDRIVDIASEIELLRIPAPPPLLAVPTRLDDIVNKLRERTAPLRKALLAGVDHRDPISDLVRSATGFVILALLFTLSLNLFESDIDTEQNMMMASMSEPVSESPFADESMQMPAIAPPTLDYDEQPTRDERKQLVQQEIDRQLAWEASLSCAHDVGMSSCTCREASGVTARLSFEHCTFLVNRSPMLQN